MTALALKAQSRLQLGLSISARIIFFSLMLASASLVASQIDGQVSGEVSSSDAKLANLGAAVRTSPGSFAAHMDLGEALSVAGQPAKALNEFNIALKLQPDSPNALSDRGLTLLKLSMRSQNRDSLIWYRQIGGAEDDLKKALQLDPQLPGMHGYLGRVYDLVGDRDAAVREFRLELKSNPESAEGWNNLGTALGEAKSYDEAIACYQRALSIDLKCTSCLLNLESAIRSQGSRIAALQRYRDEAAQSGGTPLAHLLYGMALTADYQDNAAISQLNAALDSVPDLAAAHFYLGTLKRHQGENGAAESQYRMALALDSSHPEFYEALATILIEENRDYAARKVLTEALALDPNKPSLHYKLAQILQRAGRTQSAAQEREITNRLELKDQKLSQLEVDINLGIGYLRSGKPSDAIYHLRAALTLAPNHPETNFYLGIALSQVGDSSDSFRAFEKALAWRPDSAEFHYNYGIALWQAGQGFPAIAEFRRTLEIRPNYAEAHCALGLALRRSGDAQEGRTEIVRAQRFGVCGNQSPSR